METLGVELLPGVSSPSSFSSPRIAVKRLCKEARWLLEPSLPFIFCSNVSVKCHRGASAQSGSSRPLRNVLLILHNALTGKAQKNKAWRRACGHLSLSLLSAWILTSNRKGISHPEVLSQSQSSESSFWLSAHCFN